MNFMGFRRKNGKIGVRNHILVFPTVMCAASVANKISQYTPGTVTVSHPHGCGHLGKEREHITRAMKGFCTNPNISGVLLVGLGCEMITTDILAKELEKDGQQVEVLNIQEEGGTTATIEKGKELASNLVAEIYSMKREKIDVSELVIGVKCGGSDTLSGLTANPAMGVSSDFIIENGGSVLLTETPEMIGAEQMLMKRAATEEVKDRILQITSVNENRIKKLGLDIRESEPSPGNKEGGLTTLEEKSLGAVLKGGTSAVRQVIEYAGKPSENGLIIMDGPAHDAVSITGLAAAGAQVIIFTTGRGTPVGTPIAPVIKVSSNNDLYNLMKDNIDLNAGEILDGTESIKSIGEKISKEIIDVASGKKTRAEILEHCEFAIHSIAPTV